MFSDWFQQAVRGVNLSCVSGITRPRPKVNSNTSLAERQSSSTSPKTEQEHLYKYDLLNLLF